MAEVGNWISEKTVTIGSGDITLLGTNASFVRFAQAVPAGTVWYSIIDGNNREAGIGTFNGTNTLARTTVHATLVNGVYNNSSPPAIYLSGDTAIVSCTYNTAAYNELVAADAAAVLTDGTRAFSAGYFDVTTAATPGVPAAGDLRVFAVDEGGFSYLHVEDENGIDRRISRDNELVVRNNTGVTIAKGKAVYINGATGTWPTVALADNTAESTLPAIGLVVSDIANASFGQVLVIGLIDGIDTSAFTDGDTVYVGTAGGLTATPPTPASATVQIMGYVIRSNPSNGEIKVLPSPAFKESFIDHGAIVGLSDDDHAQYLLASDATSRAAFITEWARLAGMETGATADQTAGEIEAIVNHDNLVGFVANEHIDWTSGLAAGFNSLGIDDNATSTALIINPSQYVAIGETNLEVRLTARNDSASSTNIVGYIKNRNASAVDALLAFTTGATDISDNRYSYIGVENVGTNGNDLVFASNGDGLAAVEALRIDSSQNATFAGNLTATGVLDGGSLGTTLAAEVNSIATSKAIVFSLLF
jgi:hypothetical protein